MAKKNSYQVVKEKNVSFVSSLFGGSESSKKLFDDKKSAVLYVKSKNVEDKFQKFAGNDIYYSESKDSKGESKYFYSVGENIKLRNKGVIVAGAVN